MIFDHQEAVTVLVKGSTPKTSGSLICFLSLENCSIDFCVRFTWARLCQIFGFGVSSPPPNLSN